MSLKPKTTATTLQIWKPVFDNPSRTSSQNVSASEETLMSSTQNEHQVSMNPFPHTPNTEDPISEKPNQGMVIGIIVRILLAYSS